MIHLITQKKDIWEDKTKLDHNSLIFIDSHKASNVTVCSHFWSGEPNSVKISDYFAYREAAGAKEIKNV